MIDFMTPRGHLANLIADTASFEDFSVMASCPIPTGRMQLLPLRYGLVEKDGIPKPLPMPYELQSHTTGLRLLRNGYLYVIDSTTQLLHEYRIEHGSLTALLCKAAVVTQDVRSASVGEPLMIFADTGVLHVCYAEIQWTARKCAQVLGSQEDREHFMQRVSLAGSDEFGPGQHMFSAQQVKRGLAEIAWGKTSQPRPAPPEGPEEFRPYAWEHTSLYRTTWLEELTSQVDNAQRNAYLFLAVRDDLGVMRDLAHHQDQIVGWGDALNEGGATPGQNLRDYMLGALIESQALISSKSMAQILELAGGQSVKALLTNLENQPEPEKSQISQLMLEYGKAESRPDRTAAVGSLNAAYINSASRDRAHCRAFFSSAPQAFVERHLEALIQVGNIQHEHVRSVLNGTLSGKRGVNDLIDRPAMDAFLAEYRTQLNRWDEKLRLITQDRVLMACRDNFHRSAWYFDPQHMAQIEAAFNCQNDCLKDLCRSDDACDMVLTLLEHRPLNDVPLTQTLLLSEQAALATRLAGFMNASAVLVNNVTEVGFDYRGAIRAYLPVLSDLPEAARQLGKLAHDAFAPAISRAVDKALSLQDLIEGKAPTLAQMVGKLPKVFAGRLLGAIQQSGASFEVGTHQDAKAIGYYVNEVARHRAEVKTLSHKRDLLKITAGHTSPGAKVLMAQIRDLRVGLEHYERLLARAISPLGHTDPNMQRDHGRAPGKPAIALVLPPAQTAELISVLDSHRRGVPAAPARLLVGDGVATLLFFVQAVNFAQVYREYSDQQSGERDSGPLKSAIVATATAGFAAAQGIGDTALKAHQAQLAITFHEIAVKGVNVQLGKLHLGLGFATYGVGFFASLLSYDAHHTAWQAALRSGNRAAQQAAVVSMVGAGGQVMTYGSAFYPTAKAGLEVLLARNATLRLAALESFGISLSSVFARFNLFGAMFTVLELTGIWLYNRYTTTRYDQWLQSTPWGRDVGLRRSLSLGEYCDRLGSMVSEPTAVLGEYKNTLSWWNAPTSMGEQDVQIVLPGVSFDQLQANLAIRQTCNVAISACHVGQARLLIRTVPQWREVGPEVINSLRLVQKEPLTLRLTFPLTAFEERLTNQAFILQVHVSTRLSDADARTETYSFNINPRNPGIYSAVEVALPENTYPDHLCVTGELLQGLGHV